MKDIKMSDFFELPMNLGYPIFTLGNDKKNQYKESIYVVTAINAYDDNQERIQQLEKFMSRYMYRTEMRGREPISLVESLLDGSTIDFDEQKKIVELESHAIDMGKMAEDYVDKISTLTHENALLENQLKNAHAEIAELKKKAQGY